MYNICLNYPKFDLWKTIDSNINDIKKSINDKFRDTLHYPDLSWAGIFDDQSKKLIYTQKSYIEDDLEYLIPSNAVMKNVLIYQKALKNYIKNAK